MAAKLGFDDLTKKHNGPGKSTGKYRSAIIHEWIDNKKNIPTITKKKSIKLDYIDDIIKKKYIAAIKKVDFSAFKKGTTNLPIWKDKDGDTYKITHIEKIKEFGGGGGSGGGASDTEITESLQCYYCSLLYNSNLSELTDKNVSNAQLKKYAKYCDTTVSLKEALETGPSDWNEDGKNIYIKTANALYKNKIGKKFSGNVYFHRGSKFMKSIYDRKKRCINHDKKIAAQDKTQPIAPSSFSDDKWNPGDIWMSTVAPTSPDPFPGDLFEGKLGTHTCDWDALKKVVYKAAHDGITLGVSLKKVSGSTGHVDEFNTETRSQNIKVTYKGFSFGQTGDFFSSSDIYVYFNVGTIQWRAFDSTKSWQGEIKGSAAAGGKIGGGGTNYYTEKYFAKSVGSSSNKHGKWTETKWSDSHFNTLFTLYKKYNKSQTGVTNVPPAITDIKEFKKKCNSYINNKNKNTPEAFKFGKLMGLLLIDTIIKGGPNKNQNGGTWATDTFRYAQSNTDISSYFIKIS